MTGLLVLLAALVGTAAVAALTRWKNGRFSAPPQPDDRERLNAEQIGAPLGERATMVQFSSAFCSPCRATRVLLTDVAAKVPGVVTVEIDAEDNLQLVRDLDIMRTPTVLVLDADGAVTTRASGLPRREQVMAALDRTGGPRQPSRNIQHPH
ncbi:TlpA family protein disulfide reductase [Aeromicrobium wangtongii]|uniref:TlpA family protein disulfide reductase n=1 Tax=Aeromicrobium wangtongii TaxID=2969247 RepID=UPI0020177AA8|nr:thioredoxin family protein [Aeromicrobium wangtongii]MCL3817575.1 thioredoxin family protein [Aeromicrobium wangtongii]